MEIDFVYIVHWAIFLIILITISKRIMYIFLCCVRVQPLAIAQKLHAESRVWCNLFSVESMLLEGKNYLLNLYTNFIVHTCQCVEEKLL